MADFHQVMCDEEAIVARYKDLEWTDDVRGFECARCGRVLIQHYVANCQHKFCSNCRKLVGDGSQRWRCPLCQEFIRTIERQDFEFRDRVYELGVHCPNKKYGCKHTCPLKELKGHMDECGHTRESALPVLYEGNTQVLEVLELRTEVREMRQMMLQMEKRWSDREVERERDLVDVNSRMDKISSKLRVETTTMKKENSELKDEMSLVEEENKSKMLKLDVKSEVLMEMLEKKEKKLQTEIQNMRKQMENQDEDIKKLNQSIEVMERELNESKAEVRLHVKTLKADTENFIAEKIEKVESEMRHSDRLLESKFNERVLRVNEQMDEDVSRLNAKLTEVEEKVDETLKTEVPRKKTTEKLTKQLSCFDLVEHNDNFSPDFRWKISGMKEKLERNKFRVESEVFQWAKYPAIRCRAILDFDSDNLSKVNVSLRLDEPQQRKGEVDLKLIPRVYYVIRDRTKTNDPKHRCLSADSGFKQYFDHSFQFIAHEYTKSLLNDPPYNVDGTIAIDIHVEPPKMARKVYSQDGTLDWAIENYWRRRELEKNGLVSYRESPYFYTGPKGYRVRLLMESYWSGGFKVWVNFTQGEFDADLSLTFPHQTTVTLLNRKNPLRNISKTVEKDIKNGLWYSLEVCGEEEIESMVENDTVFFNVTIKKKKTFRIF